MQTFSGHPNIPIPPVRLSKSMISVLASSQITACIIKILLLTWWIAALFGRICSKLQSRGDPLNWRSLRQLTCTQFGLRFDPKTVTTERLYLPDLTTSMPKACCFPFLAWHKILAYLLGWTSSKSWQCGWYLLCRVLSLLTIEGNRAIECFIT